MGVGLERRATPSAIAGRGRETAAAIRTELCVRFGTGTMVGTNGMRDAGCGMRRGSGYPASRISHLASRGFAAECGKRFGSVPRLQDVVVRSEEHTSELQSRLHLVCRLLLEKK